MECKEFENHIHDYFSDPNFDWKLRDEIDAHYFGCDNCFETYQIAKLMADPDIKKAAADKLADIQVQKAEGFLIENRPEESLKCLNEALELRPWDEEIEARIAEAGLGKESIEVYINGVAIDEFTVSGNKLFVELYRDGNAKHVRVVVKYLDQDDYFFVDLPHNDIIYYDLAASTEETKEGEGKILEISSKKERDASSKIILIDAIYRRRVPYKVIFDKDTDCADLVVDLV